MVRFQTVFPDELVRDIYSTHADYLAHRQREDRDRLTSAVRKGYPKPGISPVHSDLNLSSKGSFVRLHQLRAVCADPDTHYRHPGYSPVSSFTAMPSHRAIRTIPGKAVLPPLPKRCNAPAENPPI